jgi:hypothetical protein
MRSSRTLPALLTTVHARRCYTAQNLRSCIGQHHTLALLHSKHNTLVGCQATTALRRSCCPQLIPSAMQRVRRSGRKQTDVEASKLDALAGMKSAREKQAALEDSDADSEDGLTAGQRERAARRRDAQGAPACAGSCRSLCTLHVLWHGGCKH